MKPEPKWIIVPAWNAEATIENVILKLRSRFPDDVIAVVDDGSRDATVAIARKLGTRVLLHKQNRGVGAAVQTGISAALQEGAVTFATIGADDQREIEDLGRLFSELDRNNADIVVGSKFLANHAEMPFLRKLGNRFITRLFNLIHETRLSDVTSGFRAFKSSAAREAEGLARGYPFDVDFYARLVQKGFKIREIPTVAYYRDKPTKISNPWRTGAQIILSLIRDPLLANLKKSFLAAFFTYLSMECVNRFVFSIFWISAEWSVLRLIDFLFLWLLVGAIGLFSEVKNVGKFSAFTAIVFLAFHAASVTKIRMLGSPLEPDDFLRGFQFWDALPAWIIIPILAFVAMVVVGVWGWRIRPKPLPVTYSVFLFVAFYFFSWNFDRRRAITWIDSQPAYKAWSQIENYRNLGPILYFVTRALKHLDSKAWMENISPTEIRDAFLSMDEKDVSSIKPREPEHRNVYVILLESFGDPSMLKGIRFSQSPLSHRFTEAWEKNGKSWSLSPVFGGGTAKAEFEILCGQPSGLHGPEMEFDHYLLKKAPCLPEFFSLKGYETIAVQPLNHEFFNEHDAYERVGFRNFYSLKDLKSDEMAGPHLSDRSLFRQSLKIAALHSEKPKFIYIVTLAGHWPFHTQREEQLPIETNSSVSDLPAYANSIRTTSNALMDFIKDLRQQDPRGLIVALGDHLPILGRNLEGYRTSMGSENEPYWLYQTPLLVLEENQARGPGWISQFEIPKIIMQKLGFQVPENFAWFQPPGFEGIRNLSAGGFFFFSRDGNDFTDCRKGESHPPCERGRSWLSRSRILGADLISGHQWSLAFARTKVSVSSQQSNPSYEEFALSRVPGDSK